MHKEELFKFLQITLGLFICSIGIACFFWPTSFITGGASGLSILLELIFPKISNVIFLYIINIILLLISLPILGKNYFIKTLYATLMLPTMVAILEFIVEKSGIYVTLQNLEGWIIVAFSAVLMGLGQGLTLHANGSTGGLDVIGSIGFKCFHIPYSASNFIINGTIIVFGMTQTGLEKGLMAIVFMVLVGVVLDSVVFQSFGKKAVFIKSEKSEEIKDLITNTLHRGVTVIDCKGGYSNLEGKMLVCVCMSKEYVMLRTLIDSIDKSAFTFMTKAQEVRGYGFSLGVKSRKDHIQLLKDKDDNDIN